MRYLFGSQLGNQRLKQSKTPKTEINGLETKFRPQQAILPEHTKPQTMLGVRSGSEAWLAIFSIIVKEWKLQYGSSNRHGSPL